MEYKNSQNQLVTKESRFTWRGSQNVFKYVVLPIKYNLKHWGYFYPSCNDKTGFFEIERSRDFVFVVNYFAWKSNKSHIPGSRLQSNKMKAFTSYQIIISKNIELQNYSTATSLLKLSFNQWLYFECVSFVTTAIFSFLPQKNKFFQPNMF